MPWSFWAGYLEKLALVALLLGAMYAVARALRQTRFFGRASRSATLIEALALSQHAAIYIVRVGSRYFLLGGTASTVSPLTELAETDAESHAATFECAASPRAQADTRDSLSRRGGARR
jgi:flagellar biogenesis protein FliO